MKKPYTKKQMSQHGIIQSSCFRNQDTNQYGKPYTNKANVTTYNYTTHMLVKTGHELLWTILH